MWPSWVSLVASSFGLLRIRTKAIFTHPLLLVRVAHHQIELLRLLIDDPVSFRLFDPDRLSMSLISLLRRSGYPDQRTSPPPSLFFLAFLQNSTHSLTATRFPTSAQYAWAVRRGFSFHFSSSGSIKPISLASRSQTWMYGRSCRHFWAMSSWSDSKLPKSSLRARGSGNLALSDVVVPDVWSHGLSGRQSAVVGLRRSAARTHRAEDGLVECLFTFRARHAVLVGGRRRAAEDDWKGRLALDWRSQELRPAKHSHAPTSL